MNRLHIILYSFRRCPYAMRARMALAYAQIDYQHREILLQAKPQSMLSYSSKGTVPVLVIGNKVIDESLDVMHWALQQMDCDNWLMSGAVLLQNDMQKLIGLCDNKFKTQLDFYKYSDRYELSQEQYRDKTHWFLAELEERLNKHQYLISDTMSLADIAIFPFVRQYAFVNKEWFDGTEYDKLQNWLQNHLQSSLFIGIMEKHRLWQDNH